MELQGCAITTLQSRDSFSSSFTRICYGQYTKLVYSLRLHRLVHSVPSSSLQTPGNITKYRNVPGFREIPCFPFRSSTLLFVISFFIRFLFLKQDQSIALPFWYKIMLHIDARDYTKDFIGWEKRKSLPPANTTRNLWNHHWTLCISKKHTLLLSARGSPSLPAFYPFLCDSTFSEYLQPTLNLFSRLLFLYIPLEVGAVWLFYFCSQLFLVFLPCWSNRAPSCSWHSLPSWAQWD